MNNIPEHGGKSGGDIRSLLRFMGALALIIIGATELLNNWHIRFVCAFACLLLLLGVGLLVIEYSGKPIRYFRYAIYVLAGLSVLLMFGNK